MVRSDDEVLAPLSRGTSRGDGLRKDVWCNAHHMISGGVPGYHKSHGKVMHLSRQRVWAFTTCATLVPMNDGFHDFGGPCKILLPADDFWQRPGELAFQEWRDPGEVDLHTLPGWAEVQHLALTFVEVCARTFGAQTMSTLSIVHFLSKTDPTN